MIHVHRTSRGALLGLMAAVCLPTIARTESITVSGSPQKGALPIIITAFATEAGTDVLPAGSTDYYVFTLFDTGATRVVFDIVTAATLGVTNGMVTAVRINGLSAIDPLTLMAPIYPGQAQAEVQDVPVQVPATPPDVTLIGGSVTNTVKAVIDYTTTVTRGPYAHLGGESVSGPDITFYPAQDPVGITPSIVLNLQLFGSTGPGLGQRYWMYDVSFNEGSARVASPASGDMSATHTRFLYDTGTNVTLIKDVVATPLGLTGPPEFTMEVSGSTLNGYYVDSITMTGTGGTYTVLDAPVLVTPNPLGGSADAIIGSNLFSQTTLLFDGPAATLGIGVAPAYQYAFTGFDEPVDTNIVNQARAGQAIPLRWRLMTLAGEVVTDPASFAGVFSYAVPCDDTAVPGDPVEENPAGGSGLQNLGDGLWQFNWKTPKGWTGTCRALYVEFSDGQASPHVTFRFR